MTSRAGTTTHDVVNQALPLEDYDLLAADPLMSAAVEREGGGWGIEVIAALGRRVGSAEYLHWADQANRNPPELCTHDRFGHRQDEVEFHPAYHRLMEVAVTNGVHSLPYEHPDGEGARVVRDAMMWALNQVEPAHTCPISMTTSVVPALRTAPELAGVWEPAILARTYDPDLAAVGEVKRSALFGMGMLPRVLPDGTRNSILLQRLKRKLGNHANASSEMEFRGALVHRVGAEGRGVPTIIEMVNGTRLDCVIGVVGQMRQAVHQAAWHTRHRSAFGSLLADKPLMRHVLADLELEVEAATLLMMRVSGSFDRAGVDPGEAAFRRVATPIAKFWTTKIATGVVREAMECLGGNGYVEESILPRLFRESPLNAIWEGSGNVIALDVVRAIGRAPDAVAVLIAELEEAKGAHRVLDAAIDRCRQVLLEVPDPEAGARRLVEELAVTWAATLMVRQNETAVADAYVASRVAEPHGLLYGTLDPRLDLARVAARAQPCGVA